VRRRLRRFWFEFDQPPAYSPLGIGCGVTAYALDDAMALLRLRVFSNGEFQVRRVVEDVDVRTLEQGHVLPNMGLVIDRGVWFPLGY